MAHEVSQLMLADQLKLFGFNLCMHASDHDSLAIIDFVKQIEVFLSHQMVFAAIKYVNTMSIGLFS